jgi:hypothetical protein
MALLHKLEVERKHSQWLLGQFQITKTAETYVEAILNIT